MFRRKLCCIFIFIFLILIILLGYFFVNRKVQENKLFNDVSQIIEINYIEKYRFPSSSVSGQYLDLEDNIEMFLKCFSKKASKIISYGDDSKLEKLLSLDNYSKDGPEFLDSISYIEKVQSNFQQDMDSILLYFDKSYIRDYISNCDLPSYYKKLFIRAMFNEGIYNHLLTLKDDFLDSSSYINQVYQGILEVLTFLSNHSNDWKIEENEIQFSTEELVNQYKNLVSKIK